MQVQNRRTLDTLYHTLYADEIKMMEEAEHEESLYHHGVEGMSWGDRNGPPYPLGGVDKKVARAEYKAKKEKERRLKKLQKAAKKARKVKAKNAKQEAEILKKKQKLVKEGDLDKIRKNANLFTNEELQYVIERDNQKRALGSKDERTADEKFELAMKRMAQIGDIAANAGKVLSAAKTGADLITSFKSAKVKDLEAEDKRMSAIKTEFEMRFKGREDSPEAQRFVNAAVNNEQYEPSKAEKKEAKVKDKARIDATKTSALDKKANKVLDKEYAEEIRERDKAINKKIKDRKTAERKEFFDKFKKDKDGPDDQQKVKKDTAAQQETKRQFGELNNGWSAKTYDDAAKSPYRALGDTRVKETFSAPSNWSTYTTQKEPPKKVNKNISEYKPNATEQSAFETWSQAHEPKARQYGAGGKQVRREDHAYEDSPINTNRWDSVSAGKEKFYKVLKSVNGRNQADYQKAFEQASRGLGWDDKESLANEINGLLGTFGVKAPKKDNGRIVWF